MGSQTIQGPCRACGALLEFAAESIGATIPCPVCQQPTELGPPTPVSAEDEVYISPGLTVEEVEAAFTGEMRKPRAPFTYQIALLAVAVAMVLLPIIYVALIGLASWATYYWGTHFTFLLTAVRGGGFHGLMFKLFLYFAPLFSGIVLVLFMVKPLFAPAPKSAQPLALNPEFEPVLFAFIRRICRAVGAPMPTRVDVDCQLNASAGFRRGAFSFLGSDLVLTIGLPLVAGFNANQLAEVIAHEFGHFTQGFGMRVSYIIRRINGWFARIIYERDAWDIALEEPAETQESWVAMGVAMTRLAVWFSRVILKALMWSGHLIGCLLLRQMEYDADACSIRLAGSQTFEESARRLHILASQLKGAYQQMRVGWNSSKILPDNFPAFLAIHDAKLGFEARTKLDDTVGMEPTTAFATHPSHGDRIRRARQANEPGIFSLDVPATALFASFEVLARQVSLLHYTDDMGLPAQMIRTRPVSGYEEKRPEVATTEPAGKEMEKKYGPVRLRIK